MKRLGYLLILCVIGATGIQAKPVTSSVAQQAAFNFLKKNRSFKQLSLDLIYTEISPVNEPVYYVFGMNGNTGFIIIAADDAAHPVIGYSTEHGYVAPKAGTGIAAWLNKRKQEVLEIRANHYAADALIAAEWSGAAYTANHKTTATTSAVAPLVQTTWDQEPYYNAMCPGGSVTGCVATAMAQIMKFWSYPAQGTGSSSYCDCTAQGFTDNYGTLSANYGTTTYNWANMPLNVSTSNTDVATLMYQCGVSVDMDYDPNGSGAWVITADDSICAQTSYVRYFSYDPYTIQGLVRSNYADPAWIQLLENDLNIGRPIQYVGDDATQGGHTWVCDGYDASDNFHMNWGWGGQDNGYYSVNSLNPGGTINFSQDQQALIGIQPLASVPVDAGVQSVVAPGSLFCSSTFAPVIRLKNFGTDTLKSCTLHYAIDGGTAASQSWTGVIPSGLSQTVTLNSITTTSGSHTLTCYTSNPNGSADGNTVNDQSVISFNDEFIGASIPMSEGFESTSTLPSGWSIYNPDNDAAWQLSTTVSHGGTQCIGFDNCDGDGYGDMTGKIDRFYTNTYDFTGSSSSMSLIFDVAYAPYTYQGSMYTDTLAVYYSADCGSTWNNLYLKGGLVLATAPTQSSSSACWGPTSTQWRTEVVNLGSLAGQANVMFAFENRSDWGGWVYLDNINITTPNGIHESAMAGGFTMYPNPASTYITVEGLTQHDKTTYAIMDMSGRTVKSGEISGSGKETISVGDLAKGMYFFQVNAGDKLTVKKLTIQ